MPRSCGIILLATLALAAGLLDRAESDTVDLRTPNVERALAMIRPGRIEAHIRTLADDRFEGRGTGTRGYDMAARFVAAQFESIGLAPAGDRGTWNQEVPLRSAKAEPGGMSVVLRRGGQLTDLRHEIDFVMGGDVLVDQGSVDAPVVFAGFGVSAPELGYDDFAGLDCRGKIVAVLSGAPPTFSSTQRAHHSSGKTKDPILAAHGAVGVIAIRTPVSERQATWERVVRQSKPPSMKFVQPDGQVADARPELRVSVTLARSAAEALFEGAPRTLAQIFAAADSGHPPGFELPVSARLERRSTRTQVTSSNVAGLLRGSDPELANEVVVYTAHLDHLGISTPVRGDSINNGALDNATGIAAMIEIARAFAAGPRPRRSILFLAVTGEEKGMLGSGYFATHPTIPVERLVADINLDMVVAIAPIQDLIGYGAEHSTLGAVAERAAKRLGLTLAPDPTPDEVIFVRSDQYSFVRRGIPSLFLVRGHGGPGTHEKIDGWMKSIYHSPQDDLRQTIDWEGIATFARAGWLMGYEVSQDSARPAWNKGDFFGEVFKREGAGRRSP